MSFPAPERAALEERLQQHLDAGNAAEALEAAVLLDRLVPGTFRRAVARAGPELRARWAPLLVPGWLLDPRPLFYELLPVKRALVAQAGAERAAAVLADCAGSRRPWPVERRPLVSLHEHAERTGAITAVVAPPADVELRAPVVFGDASPPGVIAGRTRAFFVCELADVHVPSKSAALLAGDVALMDFQGDERAQVPTDVDVDPAVLAAVSEDELLVLRHPAVLRLDRALALVGVHSFNFGHWVFEALHKVFAVMHEPSFDGLTLLVDEQMPEQLVGLLRAFVGPDHPIAVLPPCTAARVGRLTAVSTIAYWPAGEPAGAEASPVAELADVSVTAPLLARAAGSLAHLDDGPPRRRLYLTRRSNRMVRKDEVERWFAEAGFEVLDPSELSITEQLRAFRNASVVVLEGGSAMYGLLFARPGLRVGVLTVPPPVEYEWFNETFRQLGHRLLLLLGTITAPHPKYAAFSEFEVDLDALPAFVAALEGDGQPNG